MALKNIKRVLLAKIEATYGTDPIPTAALNAMVVSDLECTPLEGDDVERTFLRGTPGNFGKLLAGTHVSVSFKVEAAGAGAAGTAPAYKDLLKACARAETITASTKVDYTLINSNEQSVTLYFIIDGIQHKITGARGSVKFAAAIGGLPTFEFSFKGLFNAPTDIAHPTASFTGWIAPEDVSNSSATFSVHGYAATIDSFEIDQANDVIYHELIGRQSIEITDRKPAGSFVCEAPTLATKDFIAIALAEAAGALDFSHGSVAGKKIQITAAQVQLGRPSYAEKNGVVTLNVPFVVLDDFVITIK